MTAITFAFIFAVAVSAAGGTQGLQDENSLHVKGAASFQSGEYARAEWFFEQALSVSRSSGNIQKQGLYLANLMSCRFALRQYREAAKLYEQAKTLAKQSHDQEGLAVLAINMSSLYAHVGDVAAAARMAAEARGSFTEIPGSRFWGVFLLQESVVLSAGGNFRQAIQDLRECIAESNRRGDNATETRAWELLGTAQWKNRQYKDAELSFQRATQMQIARQKETSPDLERRMALLRQSEGRFTEALSAFDRAIAKAARMPNGIPGWLLFYQKGVLLREMGHGQEAMAMLDSAVNLARKWRRTVLPAQAADHSDAGLNDLYGAYLDIGYDSFSQTGDKFLLRRLFTASEEDRALSLQASSSPALQWQNRVAPSYWEKAAELRNLYARTANAPMARESRRIQDLEWLLSEQELKAGLEMPELGTTRKASFSTSVGSDQLFLSFHLNDDRSYVFVLSQNDLQIFKIESRGELRRRVKAFRELLQANSPEAKAVGRDLYSMLFGQLSPASTSKKYWMVALDDELFELPFAALTVPTGRYFVESHSLEVVPSLRSLRGAAHARLTGTLVALGDPVFHAADSRWQWKSRSTGAGPVLPRLPGSGREVRQCAKSWRGQSELLIGNDVTLDHLARALRTNPAVVHFATHIVPVAERSDQPLIALGAGAKAESEFLTAREIARFHLAGSLVVMNGCHSGAGKTLPRVGLMGLTRAWLMAGAGDVVASYWPTSDDGGPFFAQFYLAYQQKSPAGRPAADALREAQLEMLRSGEWRAQPKYWASYFSTGRN